MNDTELDKFLAERYFIPGTYRGTGYKIVRVRKEDKVAEKVYLVTKTQLKELLANHSASVEKRLPFTQIKVANGIVGTIEDDGKTLVQTNQEVQDK